MGLGDRVERKDAHGTWGAKHRMVELQSSKRGGRRSGLIFLFWFCFFSGLVVAIVMVVAKRGNKDERLAATEELTVPAAAGPQDPTITLTEVSAGVYHLEFGGNTCDEVQCLKDALGLVLERVPGRRIVSVAPIGVYGSPFAFVVVTALQ